jgi:hypothetical protein
MRWSLAIPLRMLTASSASFDSHRDVLDHYWLPQVVRPSRSMLTVLAMRRCRVSAVLASSIKRTYRDLLLYDRLSKKRWAPASSLSACAKSGDTITSRGSVSSSSSTVTSSPAATPAPSRPAAPGGDLRIELHFVDASARLRFRAGAREAKVGEHRLRSRTNRLRGMIVDVKKESDGSSRLARNDVARRPHGRGGSYS